MSEYIDVFCHRANEKSSFVVDTTGPLSVNVAPGSSMVLYSNENSVFSAFDNFRILSVGVALPESFNFAQVNYAGPNHNTGLLVELNGYDLTNESAFSLPFSGGAAIVLPLENYEMPLDVFVNMEALKSVCPGPFQLMGSIVLIDPTTFPRVSMVGVPSPFNGTTQTITLFTKILHNKPLSLA